MKWRQVLPDVRELRPHQLGEPGILVVEALGLGDTRRQQQHEEGPHGGLRISYPGIPCQRTTLYIVPAHATALPDLSRHCHGVPLSIEWRTHSEQRTGYGAWAHGRRWRASGRRADPTCGDRLVDPRRGTGRR